MGARPSSFTQPATPVASTLRWSEEQELIFHWFRKWKNSNAVVRARAGTGKTTTLAEGAKQAPEEQIIVCAFSRAIADTLTETFRGTSVESNTIHALGLRAIGRTWRRVGVGRAGERSDYLTGTQVKSDAPKGIRKVISLLHTKGRDMLPLNPTVEGLVGLAYEFDLVPGPWYPNYSVEWVAEKALGAMLHAAVEPPSPRTGIDFSDMIYLPLVHGLLTPEYGLGVVDEAQDMTVAQLEFVERIVDGRICIVGDDRQAIYGFRGADTGSLDRLKTRLNATELSLKTTYRCGQSIVRHAQQWVPDIAASTSNPEGIVQTADVAQMLLRARPGDFILSRINAPLVGLAMEFLKRRIPAKVRGRDIGSGISMLVKQLTGSSETIVHLLSELDKWESKTSTKLASMGRVDLAVRAHDQAAIVRVLAEYAENVWDICQACQTLFEDTTDADQILLSSVHKAKGLEADTVYVLQDSFGRWGNTPEEDNLRYVATTRAKNKLVLVHGGV